MSEQNAAPPRPPRLPPPSASHDHAPPPTPSPRPARRSRARALPSRVRLSLSPPFVALPFLLLLCLLCLASSVSAASLASRRLVHPALGDVTAVASYALDARTVITALGSNDVPSRVHFVAHCDAAGGARHDGAFALPGGRTRALRRRARPRLPRPRHRAIPRRDRPRRRAHRPSHRPPPRRGRPRRRRRAPRATPTSPPAFVFATWTAPSRLVLVEVDERTRRLREDTIRRATMPPGVDFVRARRRRPARGRRAHRHGRRPLRRRRRRRRNPTRRRRRRPPATRATRPRGREPRTDDTPTGSRTMSRP